MFIPCHAIVRYDENIFKQSIKIQQLVLGVLYSLGSDMGVVDTFSNVDIFH